MLCSYLQLVYRVYLKCSGKLLEWVTHTKRGQRSCQCISADSFRGTIQQRLEFSPLDFYLWGDFKLPSVFISDCKWRKTSPTHLLCLLHHAQLRWLFWKECGSPWSDVTSRAVYRWRIVWVFVVNCDLISNKNWTVIRLGTCIVNVLFKNRILHS
jgi:hypothetical protein